METQTRSKLLEVIDEQAEIIERLNSLVSKLIADNAEKENLINELCKEGIREQ